MNTSNQVLQLINFDHLWISAAFFLLAFAVLKMARPQPAFAYVSAVAFGYCAAVQLAIFVFELMAIEQLQLREALSTVSRLWPAIFLVGAATALGSSHYAGHAHNPT